MVYGVLHRCFTYCHVAVNHAQETAGGCCMFSKKTLISVVYQKVVLFVVILIMANTLFGQFVFMHQENPANAVFLFEEMVRLVDCEKQVLFFGDFNCVYLPADRANQSATSDSSALF